MAAQLTAGQKSVMRAMGTANLLHVRDYQCQSSTTSTVVKAPLVRASLVKRRYIKYVALPFLPNATSILDAYWSQYTTDGFLDPYYIDFNIACILSTL